MRVLIIGHEADFDAGVQQALADLGVDWTLRFATNATQALRLVQSDTFDVVVSELRPVGMEGTALLERVRAHKPQAARLMLLDEQESGQALKALGPAHRLLHKPLRAEELLEAVESIADLIELLNSPELKTAVGRIERLPPPPQLYLKLSRAVNDPQISLSAIADLVSQDPVMAAKVLRLCNSAFFSGGRTVADVRSAVIRLGQQELRRLVLASEVFRDGDSGGVHREALRRRSLIAAQLAARIVTDASAEMASTAALLAEVGMLLPGVRTLDEHGQLLGEGPHYAEAGAYLLGLWGLPMPIVEAVANHHQPRRARSRGFWLGGAVHVARALAAGHPVDEGYLQLVGVHRQLPEWRRLAAELGASAAAEAEAPAPPQNAEQRAAEQLLQRQLLVESESDGVHYTLLGIDPESHDAVEAVDALLLLRRFDAIAIEACAHRLPGAAARRPAIPGRWALMRAGLPARDLLDWGLACFAQRVEQHSGQPLAAARREAMEAAVQRKLPLWPIDRDLDYTLQFAGAGLPGSARLRLWLRLALQRSPPLDDTVIETLRETDLVMAALLELGLPRELLHRVCLVERQQHMAVALRERARRGQAKQVLVVVSTGHVHGIRRGLRAAQPSPAEA